MKIFYLLLGITCLLTSCAGDQDNSEPVQSSVQAINLGEFQLTEQPGGYQRAVKYGPDGKILEEGMLKNGKRNGTWIVYHANKPYPASVSNFVEDEYSGPYLQYSNVGQLELLCHYTANQLDGEFIKYKNARILEEGSYKNGQYDGLYKRYYPNKEIVQQEANYKNGQLDGKSSYYSEEGALMMEYEYKDGEKIGGGIVN